MTRAVFFVVGAFGAAVLSLVLVRLIRVKRLQRVNVSGNIVPVIGGLIVGDALIAALTVLFVEQSDNLGTSANVANRTAQWCFICALAFSAIGLVDDLWGATERINQSDDSTPVRGFQGHIESLRRGRMTTGGFKLLAGGLAGVVFAWLVTEDVGLTIVGGLLIALSANAMNLFDRAPGRALKVATPLLLVLVIASDYWRASNSMWLVLGAFASLTVFDVKSKEMLGDTGANAIGALLAVVFLASASIVGAFVALVCVAALNLVCEKWSLSSVIEQNAVLSKVDRFGRGRQELK